MCACKKIKGTKKTDFVNNYVVSIVRIVQVSQRQYLHHLLLD
jgi:hypothetical protein